MLEKKIYSEQFLKLFLARARAPHTQFSQPSAIISRSNYTHQRYRATAKKKSSFARVQNKNEKIPKTPWLIRQRGPEIIARVCARASPRVARLSLLSGARECVRRRR